jgi:hypothetical protein
LITPSQTADVKCDRKTEVQMDNALAKLLIVGQNKLKFPTNERQLRPYCNQALRLFDMVSKFTQKCLPKFGRDSAAVILHTIGAELKGICKNGRVSKKAKELLTAANCANAGLQNYQECNLNIIDAFMGILNEKDIRRRIPMACCNFHELVKCLLNEAEEVKVCTRKTVDFVVKYVTKVIEPIMLLLCNNYDESNAKCDQLVRETPKRNATQKRYKSVLLPTLNIAMSLEEYEF